MAKKDIFKEPLDPLEGIQDFSPAESAERLQRVPRNKRSRFCVVKERRPEFYPKEDWKPLWSIQRKDKMKALGIKCLK